ncbi:Synergin gamma [Schistosoma japonicum]|uniref:Synergin gamma n=3 Tax=Schistosoma japonicum TaxID=6182 RepID=A0A4Z2DS36_SCHJA|nr:Synergin gamma [Schistosoma japonicum]
MISKSKVSTSNSCAPSLEEQRRRFESTQLKLQMLSRKSEEIHIDDYIKKLALDHSFVSIKDGNKLSVSKAKMISSEASTACVSTHSLPTCSGHTSDVFSFEPVYAKLSHLLDFPEVGYLNTANSFFPSNCLLKPSWLMNLSSLPPIYGDAIRAATTTHGLDSSVIYEIFRSSNLSTETLYHIWSLTSCTQPGWFTPTELVTALALIGLAQRKQWEFPSRSPSEAITIESLYEQLYAPVPLLHIPGSDRQTNSINSISGLGSSSQEIIGTSLQDPLHSSTSKFLFQPPTVAFSTFPNKLDTDTISSHQLSQLSSGSNGLNNSVSKILDPPMHFISSTTSPLNDPEWSDFTSFDSSVERQKQNSNDTPKSLTEVEFSAQKSSFISTSDTLFDDEFGDFQTSLNTVSSKPIKIVDEFSHSNVSSTADNTALKSPLQKYTFNIHNPIDSQNKMNSSESLEEQWLRCLTGSLKVFNDSLLVLSSLKNVKNQLEFAESTEGSNFLLDATEIYLITRRINISSRKYNVLTPSMQEIFSDIENSFHKLSSYAVVTDLKNKVDQALMSTSPSESECIIQDFMNPALFSYCGVCLSSINLISDPCINSHSNESSDSSQHQTNHHLVHINLAGRHYHISCANFWMNRVDPCLPAFKIPS